MKQLEVQILHQSFRLSCPEGQEERLLNAVQQVDAAMTRIRDAGKVRSRERIAALAAVNLAFDALAPVQPPAATPTDVPADGSDGGAAERWLPLLARLDAALADEGPATPR